MARNLPLKLKYPIDLLPIVSEKNKKPLKIENNQDIIFELDPPISLTDDLDDFTEKEKFLAKFHFKMFLLNLNFNKNSTKTRGLVFIFKKEPRTTLLEPFDNFTKEKWDNYKSRMIEYDPLTYFESDTDIKIVLPQHKEGRFLVISNIYKN